MFFYIYILSYYKLFLYFNLWGVEEEFLLHLNQWLYILTY